MCKKNDDALMFVCCLIEAIGRQVKRRRGEIVAALGKAELERLYQYADVLHCESIEKVADECISKSNITAGKFDNVADCKYNVPSLFDIGKVYERLIEDLPSSDDVLHTLIEVYTSWIDGPLSDYNIAVYYQSRDYILACYQAKNIL